MHLGRHDMSIQALNTGGISEIDECMEGEIDFDYTKKNKIPSSVFCNNPKVFRII